MNRIHASYAVEIIDGSRSVPVPPAPSPVPIQKSTIWKIIKKWFSSLFILCLISTGLSAQSSNRQLDVETKWIGSTIDLVNKLMAPSPKPIQMARANAKKGRLIKKYNRWLKRKKIDKWQYDSLVSELLAIDIHKLRIIKMAYD